MFMASIKSIAGDCERTHRWCKVNLTGSDEHAQNPLKLSQRRVIKIGKTKVRIMSNGGTIETVDPYLIQRVW